MLLLGSYLEIMARPVERIEQDLAAIEEAIASLAVEFQNTYSKYLALLGQAVRKHLMLAGYQVCTQGYPESFLSLSFTQRQQLQQELRNLTKEAQNQLLSSLNKLNNLSETTREENLEPTSEELPEPLESMIRFNIPLEPNQNLEIAKTELIQPQDILEWQEELEEAIAETLQTLSLQSNRLLQKMAIIPENLPVKVLEAAAKAEASDEPTPGAANLLNLLVESKNDEDSEDSTLTRIVAIHLRLSEIEFAESTLTMARTQIRNLIVKANKFQREYRKTKRERAVAEAEAAWRSSWYDD